MEEKEEEDKEDEEELGRLRAKMGMLPRLAESLMSRVVLKKGSDGDDGNDDRHPPSAEDWDLYLRSLEEQGREGDALEALRGVECAGGGGAEGGISNPPLTSPSSSRRIHDESDVETHDGSLIRLSHRERAERMAKLCLTLGRNAKARRIYREDLLGMLPDQWSYWKGLLESSEAAARGGDPITNID